MSGANTLQKMRIDTVIPLTVVQMGFLLLVQGFILNAGLSHLATNHSDAVWVAVCLGVSGLILQGSAIYAMVSEYVTRVWIGVSDSTEVYSASANDLKKVVGLRVVGMLGVGTALGLSSILVYTAHLGSRYGELSWMTTLPVAAVLWGIVNWLAAKLC